MDKLSIFGMLQGLIKRLLAKAAAVEENSLNVVAVDTLDKMYMDVTQTKTYTLVPAASFPAGTRINVRHPDQYAASTVPVIACSVGDIIYYGGGTTSTISLDQGNAVVLVLVSDGINSWGL